MNGLSDIDSSYRIEIIRKAIHFCSISIPVIYFFIPRSTALYILIPMTIAFAIVDIARYYYRPIEEWFYKTFGQLLRRHESDKEKKRLNGATNVLIAATLCVLIFPKIIAVTSLTILIISDSTSALVGKRFGKHRFFGKSLEGSLGFFLSGLVVIAVVPKIEYQLAEYLIGVIAAAIGTVVEALSIEIDDNLSIPISISVTMWAAYHVGLPMLNVYKFG